jgi:hypothetical protein
MRDLKPDRPHALHFSTFILVQLTDAARQRKVSPEILAEMIITTVAREGLIDAVLDDQPVKRRIKRVGVGGL